jgi:hypothetical protein
VVAIPYIIVFAVFLVVVVLASLHAHRYWKAHKKHSFWYEFSKDFASPFLLAVLGGFLAYQFEKQRDREAENERKAAILREMMTTRNGPDVASFTAIGYQLTVHLQRYKRFLKEADESRMVDRERKNLDEKALFDEKAIYFFYGMFRVARADFLATKGYVLYPRLWMEVAFDRLTSHVINRLMCMDERELQASPEEEAALYRYFGASRAMYSSSRNSNLRVPDLSEFAHLVGKQEALMAPTTPDDDAMYGALRTGFTAFQDRLRSGCIKPDEIIAALEAIEGLDDYAFNTLFSKWYGKFQKAEVALDLPKAAPSEFLPYPLERFEPQREVPTWDVERQKAWKEIDEVVPTELKPKKN